MTVLEIRKKLLYYILQEKKFRFSDKIFREAIPLIHDYLEKNSRKRLKVPLSHQITSVLKNEFRKINYSCKKIKGGNQQKKILKKLITKRFKFLCVMRIILKNTQILWFKLKVNNT